MKSVSKSLLVQYPKMEPFYARIDSPSGAIMLSALYQEEALRLVTGWWCLAMHPIANWMSDGMGYPECAQYQQQGIQFQAETEVMH